MKNAKPSNSIGSSSGTPFNFNFLKDGKAVGHTVIFGRSSSGKCADYSSLKLTDDEMKKIKGA